MSYELGWDVSGRRCIVDAMGNWVTNIPADMAPDEVIRRLENGKMKVFDARNQGMQNCPAAMVDTSEKNIVAPREDWPIYNAMMDLWMVDVFQDDFRSTDEIFDEAKKVRDAGGNIETVVYRYVSKPARRERVK